MDPTLPDEPIWTEVQDQIRAAMRDAARYRALREDWVALLDGQMLRMEGLDKHADKLLAESNNRKRDL